MNKMELEISSSEIGYITQGNIFFAMMRGINFACLSIDYITFLFLFTNFTCMKLKS